MVHVELNIFFFISCCNPLQNNFSPTCAAVEDAAFAESKFDKYSIAPDEYVCDACPRGYAGSHCERSVDNS